MSQQTIATNIQKLENLSADKKLLKSFRGRDLEGKASLGEKTDWV